LCCAKYGLHRAAMQLGNEVTWRSVAVERAQHVHIHAHRLEPFAPTQFGQVYHKGTADNLGTKFVHQLDPGLGRAASGQQIIHNQHLLPRLQRIFVDLNNRLAVFTLWLSGAANLCDWAAMASAR